MVDDFLEHYVHRLYKPYFFLKNLVGSVHVDNHFRKYISAAPNLIVLNKGKAVASWNDSPWDTRNTGYKTARINFLMAQGSVEEQTFQCGELYRQIEEFLSADGYEYILFRIHTSDLPPLRMAQDNGFQVVDGLTTLMTEVSTEHVAPTFVLVRPAKDNDMKSVRKIAQKSFIFDRFHTDPAIPDSVADKLHGRWIEDSFAINLDDRVIVSESGGKILGFLSYSVNSALSNTMGIKIMNIILLATHTEARGMGVAKSLVNGAANIARAESFSVMLVGTQLRNMRATSLYEALGFRTVDSSYTFRKLLNGERI